MSVICRSSPDLLLYLSGICGECVCGQEAEGLQKDLFPSLIRQADRYEEFHPCGHFHPVCWGLKKYFSFCKSHLDVAFANLPADNVCVCVWEPAPMTF